ncbi:PAS domain S-box protein [Ferruginibacter sp. SUN106]|uniref:PAS domain-containing sensor histidine kinase n=1 Tax=Ferruginibacter sp. SUN106 TaxID=2978348 RepID=UPI003D36A9B2
MNPLANKQTEKAEAFLSVSYKAGAYLPPDQGVVHDAVIITNTQFYITGFNATAATTFNLSENIIATTTLSDAITFDFKNTSRQNALSVLLKNGSWNGEIIFTRQAGKQLHFYTTASLINNNNTVVITSKLITEDNSKNQSPIVQADETFFSLFMAKSKTGCWIYDEKDFIVFANPAYTDSTGFEGNPIGKHISEIFPAKLAEKLIARNKETFKKNKAQITEHSLTRPDGTVIHFVSNIFIFKTADGKRYIGGQAIDVTDRKNSEEQIKKIHERFTYAVNATSEAVWDLDLQNNEIYRSDAFYKISGYTKEQVAGDLNWWFNKIHPEDKDRVKKSFEKDLLDGKRNWEDEYRFQYADGTYRNIADKGFAIYDGGKPVRLIGAIQDITERKKLEAQLLAEQVKKQKLINQATIEAQEKERGMISAELHDNVNQLLMSARLHIGAAKKSDIQEELLNKASDYLLQAVEEIRSLSKRLNTSIVKSVGLEQSIFDITRNMKQFNDITVTVDIDKDVIDKLTQEQQLVVFRIIQEQSNNIIKYSRAAAATFSLTEKNNQCCLVISDNGIGFDKAKQKANGIGFINIFNRIDAYNGKVEIITYPDNGCTLNISMPYVV